MKICTQQREIKQQLGGGGSRYQQKIAASGGNISLSGSLLKWELPQPYLLGSSSCQRRSLLIQTRLTFGRSPSNTRPVVGDRFVRTHKSGVGDWITARPDRRHELQRFITTKLRREDKKKAHNKQQGQDKKIRLGTIHPPWLTESRNAARGGRG